MSFRLRFVKPAKRHIVKEPAKLLDYLKKGGNPNSVPIFKDDRQEMWIRTCCFPCWLANDSNLTFLDEECWRAETAFGDDLTLLHWAVIYGVSASVRLLIEHGADVEHLTLDKQFSPYHVALQLKTLSAEDLDFLQRARANQYLREKALLLEGSTARRRSAGRGPKGGSVGSESTEIMSA